jgi:hypothetical protein
MEWLGRVIDTRNIGLETFTPSPVFQGTLTNPRWPFASMARTPKITLSLEIGSDTVTVFPGEVAATCLTYCQFGAVVSRHNTS